MTELVTHQPENLAELTRVRDLVNESRQIHDVAKRVDRGSATPAMIEQTLPAIDRSITYADEVGDKYWAKAARDLKTSFEAALASGCRRLPTPKPQLTPEMLRVDLPLILVRAKAKHRVRRQVRCPSGIVDIVDDTAKEIIECKVRGNASALAHAGTQLQRYREHFPDYKLSIAVPKLDRSAVWLAAILCNAGIDIIETEVGGDR